MAFFSQDYIEKIYSGWLAKVIGVRLGAPVEGWTYEQIRNIYGELDHYPVKYKNFAADDDTNGPLFFLRALEDKPTDRELTAQDVADALLNYAPFEHGFFWWGGYGTSTEHTAYLNLRNGITAPRSGSVEQNGAMMAEQIGGQIFIDTWGLVTPGNPDLAAKLAEAAASVTHGRNGVYGGIFIAVCISYAFIETDMIQIIEKGLSYIPADSEYTRVVRAVMDFYRKDKEENGDQADWEACYRYIFENFGYDKYPGVCHIIPNIAVMILSMLYGEGDFSDTINICNRCGWDTDCNVGNVATIIGVRNGLEDIDYAKWREPIGDLLICSSVIGSLNIMDIPYGAVYIAKLAAALAGEDLPEPWAQIAHERIDSCHFEFPGSTHNLRAYADPAQSKSNHVVPITLSNTTEAAFTGERSLKIAVQHIDAGDEYYVYKKTYYSPEDFSDSRYDPSFSPLAYPGQTIHAAAMIPDYGNPLAVQLFARDLISGETYRSDSVDLDSDWKELSWQIPSGLDALIAEIGLVFKVYGKHMETFRPVVFVDDLYVDGQPDYVLDFSKAKMDVWNPIHVELAQFTKLKGLLYLEEGQMHLSASDFAETYTGRHDWDNYEIEFDLTPLMGSESRVNVRVQGALRSYAIALTEDSQIALLKNNNGYSILQQAPFAWKRGEAYRIGVKVEENMLSASVNGEQLISFKDESDPYMHGSIGYSAAAGSHLSSKGFTVKPLIDGTIR